MADETQTVDEILTCKVNRKREKVDSKQEVATKCTQGSWWSRSLSPVSFEMGLIRGFNMISWCHGRVLNRHGHVWK
ncbi:hypothetical protein KSP40_PGU002648 [Platanthera guangdongensis]|uniref:Uncharacterized protein n=1 Tax=Platanthera guangdongensis TaxID=2320717 RepID=A0ABR2M3U0_9ASPA